MELINLILNIVIVILLTILIIILIIKKDNKTNNLSEEDFEKSYDNINNNLNELSSHFDTELKHQTELIDLKNNGFFEKTEMILNHLKKEIDEMHREYDQTKELINTKLDTLNKNNNESNEKIKEKLSFEIKEFNLSTKESLKEFNFSIKESFKELKEDVDKNLKEIRNDNNDKLEKINISVNEKLEKTLEGKLKQSFDNVVEQISGVNQAIGEIKGIASDVGSLKTVLTNVKTKGIVGEVILGNIIREILTTSQYFENVITKVGSAERVEFAIKMPINESETVLLPIDSKLPLESYHKIKEGIELGDKGLVKEQRKILRDNIKKYAKDIKEKYIDTPNTTDFAILFLPIEGLYIEALDMGLFDEVYKEYRIYLAGPTTLAAILNALQISFKTLAIQKKSSDVFKLLEAVKAEFSKFAESLKKTQEKLGVASKELDNLVGTRTRQMQKRLNNIHDISIDDANKIIGFDDSIDEGE